MNETERKESLRELMDFRGRVERAVEARGGEIYSRQMQGLLEVLEDFLVGFCFDIGELERRVEDLEGLTAGLVDIDGDSIPGQEDA